MSLRSILKFCEVSMMQHCYTTLISESKNWSVGSKVASDTYSAILDTYVLLGLEAEVAELKEVRI